MCYFTHYTTGVGRPRSRGRQSVIVCIVLIAVSLIQWLVDPQYKARAEEMSVEDQAGSPLTLRRSLPKARAKELGRAKHLQRPDDYVSLITAEGQPAIIDGSDVLTSMDLNAGSLVMSDSLRLRLADGRYLRVGWDRYTGKWVVETRYKAPNRAESFRLEVVGSYVSDGSKIRLQASNGLYLAADYAGELVLSSVPYEFTLAPRNTPDDVPADLPPSAIAYDRNGRGYESRFERLAQQLLRRRAQNKAEFDKIIEEVFGEDFDRHEAEELRKKMAANDFSWAPSVQLVAPEVLHGNSGAYAAFTHTVYLNDQLSNKFVRAFVYLEELGHHLDTLLKPTDSPGDEGALFRIFMADEQPSADELARIRRENDHGSITVNGEEIEVEFLFGWLSDLAGAAWGGIKSGAGWVWKGAKTAGSALKTAASKAWHGSEVLASWIEEGAEWAADKYVESCRRSFWTVYQETNTLVNSLVVMGYGTVEGVQVMVQGVKEIANGNFVDGGAALFVGLAKLYVEMPLDVVSSEVIESLSSLQTMLFLEPEGRYLTDHEKEFLSTVFGDVWWLNLIRVKEGFCGLWSVNPRPFTVETTIYLKKWPYSEALLTHESTHVWQYIHGGGDYKIQSLHAQYIEGGAYGWETAVNAHRPWSGLNVEQQAELVEDAFDAQCFELPDIKLPKCRAGVACRAPTPVATCQINNVDRTWFFVGVRSSLLGGDGAP